VDAIDDERARIARELHDGVGQKLAVLQMSLAHLAQSLPADTRAAVLDVQAQVSELSGELHAISKELYPSRLQLLGLAKALEALCRETSHQSGLDIAFAGDAAVSDIGARESLYLYRIVQEAIQNIVKHSHARHASVRLVREARLLIVTISDLGTGFDDSQPASGLGMTNMRQRAQLLGGDISVQTRPGGGTRIRVGIPIAGN
jgi:two-component system sensor histidine kinase UhpB